MIVGWYISSIPLFSVSTLKYIRTQRHNRDNLESPLYPNDGLYRQNHILSAEFQHFFFIKY